MITGIVSYAIAALAFSALSILLMVSKQSGHASKVLILASVISLFWACGWMALTIWPTYFWVGTVLLDPLRIFSWALLVHVLLNKAKEHEEDEEEESELSRHKQHWLTSPVFLLCAGFVIIFQLMLLFLPFFSRLEASTQLSTLTIIWMLAPLTGLYLVEQLYVNTRAKGRAAARYLCVGLAAMFLFDFFLFTDTLLFKHIRIDIWYARGILYSILVPVVAITVARNPSWAVELHVSRQAVTTSATFLGAGIYLVTTAFAASLIRFGQFEGVNIISVSAIVLSLAVLVVVLLSKRFRAKVRVSVSKHFFNFKYDYRTEWLKFTRTLASDIDSAPRAIVQGLIDIVDSNAGVLWGRDKNGGYTVNASIGELIDTNISKHDLVSLKHFLDETGWLIDLEELRLSPSNYKGLALSQSLLGSSDAWLIIPLPFQDQIEGFVLVAKSSVVKNINWEDRDLLKTAGRQAAGLLAQRRAHQELKEASQFEAFSKLSAYIVHDLKNILGQQSLIVSNARKHKHNPEFVDDVVTTIENSVERMTSLLMQLREPTSEDLVSKVELNELLRQVTDQLSKNEPTPLFKNNPHGPVMVFASEAKLSRVFSHIVQNAQEATPKHGDVQLILELDEFQANITVRDTGTGMTPAFIRDKLFAAFESTKGLTGMGIGVYESREYIRSLGGEILVESTVGAGSIFSISIPLATTEL